VREPHGSAGVIYTKRDVTPLKVQRDARMVQARFSAALQIAPDAVIIVNAIGRVVFVNSQAVAVFGYAPAELIGLRPRRHWSAKCPTSCSWTSACRE
jgi:PAS domain-containing protein